MAESAAVGRWTKVLASPGAPPPERDLTVAQALRTPQFAAIALTFFACCAAHSGPIFHMVANAMDHGISAMAAATVLSVGGVASLAGKIVCGVVADRVGAKRTLVAHLARSVACNEADGPLSARTPSTAEGVEDFGWIRPDLKVRAGRPPAHDAVAIEDDGRRPRHILSLRAAPRVDEPKTPCHREIAVGDEAIAEAQTIGQLLAPLVGIGRDRDDFHRGALGLR